MNMNPYELLAIAALKSGMCPHNRHEFDEIAEWCFKVADAMIRQNDIRKQERMAT